MEIPHPIPYQGSKRSLAKHILAFFPDDADRLIEPFAGSAAVSLAALHHNTISHAVIGDADGALVSLWKAIQTSPNTIADAYTAIWQAQFGNERQHYDDIRAEFNRTQRPDYFLFLLTRCVKAAVRYNASGEFNQSPDLRRKGTHPDTLRKHLLRASTLLQSRATFLQADYRDLLVDLTPSDLIYLDPPYQGVSRTRDPRYREQIDFDHFVDALNSMNERSLRFIVSYDGQTGAKTHGQHLPDFLNLTRIELDAGVSSQATLLGRQARTIESLYLSPALTVSLNDSSRATEQVLQLSLLEIE